MKDSKILLPACVAMMVWSSSPVLSSEMFNQADIDGNGAVDALTDGLMLLRYLFGLRGDMLIGGAVSPDATRSTAADIEGYIQSYMP